MIQLLPYPIPPNRQNAKAAELTSSIEKNGFSYIANKYIEQINNNSNLDNILGRIKHNTLLAFSEGQVKDFVLHELIEITGRSWSAVRKDEADE